MAADQKPQRPQDQRPKDQRQPAADRPVGDVELDKGSGRKDGTPKSERGKTPGRAFDSGDYVF